MEKKYSTNYKTGAEITSALRDLLQQVVDAVRANERPCTVSEVRVTTSMFTEEREISVILEFGETQ